ncbi:hypothetical protein NW739_05285 [Mycoplasmopsis felis]|nr:phosphoenolpyruvate-utilizing N-terminal domain-containing protein [Mycoplasmopsis felis]MCU9940088.1 hypothetical protein [Mycoplasmopsis felis]
MTQFTNNIDAELNLYKSSRDVVVNNINKTKELASKPEHAAIFQAHIDFVLDPYAIETIENNIKNNKYTAEYAVNSFYTEFANMFANMDDEYMKERSSDVKDVLKKYYMH